MNAQLQNQMFLELRERKIFDQARQYAFAYIDEVFDRNVYPSAEALEGLTHFDEELPASPTPAESVLTELHTYGAPATVTQTGGRYFGFVTGGVVPAGLAAKWLSDFWDQNTAVQVMSPVSAKLETVVEGWLRSLFNLPERTVAGFVSGSFSATFCALAAARFRILSRLGWDVNERGLFGAPAIRLVTGRQVHSAVLKAVSLLGLGQESIQWIDVDEQGRIIPEQIPELNDRTILILQAGNVNSGCFEAFGPICDRAARANTWVHIDGAFGLWVAASASLRHLTKGIEKANSWALDGHKTLNTPYDCGIVLCEDKEALVSALHTSGAYIMLSDERDGMFFTPEMSRRARIIEVWAVMKYLGREGIDALVYGLHERTVQFADELRARNFDVLNDVVFNQILVYCGSDELTMKVLERVQALRDCWCGGSVWHHKKVIRISVCSWATTAKDISRSVQSFVKARDELNENR